MSDQLILNNSKSEIEGLLGKVDTLDVLGIVTDNLLQIDEFVAPSANMVIGNESRFAYLDHFNDSYDREHWWVQMDHCYARPWNPRSENNFSRPTKILFGKAKSQARKQDDEIINVTTVDDEAGSSIYDKAKAKQLMDECETHAKLARPDDSDKNWEDSVLKVNWDTTQHRLFNGMVNILNSDVLARLAYLDSNKEAVSRRIIIDKSVSRVRKLMATVWWNIKYTQWLHQVLIEHLSQACLASYLDILQTLRTKLPNFVDKLMGNTSSSRLNLLSYESLYPLLRREWDPMASSILQDKPKKLPGTPLLIVVPSTPISSKRMLKWINLLSNLATVITIPSNYPGTPGHKSTLTSCVDHMFVMTRNKVADLKMEHPGRNIVLVGFGFGATLALQVAQVEQVLCVISLGFSLLTAEGRRGEPDDSLLELQCPVLFVIGQCSSTSMVEDMEDLRERMRVETALVVVGFADDNLRVSKKKKLAEGITQSVVDRCIADEIGEFIGGIILSPYPPQLRQSPTNLTVEPSQKKSKIERKRYNSNTSSVDSEPPSPTPRLNTRPGSNLSSSLGRPPGSRKKLEQKWAFQGTPSTPSNSPPHLSTPHTPDTSSNDSNLTEKVNELPHFSKKVKTIKPTTINQEKTTCNQTIQHSSPNTVKALGLGHRPLLNMMQPEIGSVGKTNHSGIRVIENVKLNPAIGAKMMPHASRLVDISKFSVANVKSTSTNSSIIVLPDGKIKNVATSKQPGKIITSKKQLISKRPSRPVKKLQLFPPAVQTPTLAPPTNLTTQDILDLPIIFADDNQIIDNSFTTEISQNTEVSSPPDLISSKFMVVNKPSYIVQTSTPRSVSLNSQNKPPPKYTKIILSKKPPNIKPPSGEMAKQRTEVPLKKAVVSDLQPEAETKHVKPLEPVEEQVDFEKHITPNAVFKNEDGIVEVGSSTQLITDKPLKLDEKENCQKRTAEQAELTSNENNTQKTMKLDQNSTNS